MVLTLLLTTFAAVLSVAFPAVAHADQAITSAGPLTNIGISSDLNCSVNRVDDTFGEFFGDTACATLVASGGTLYGPASIPAGSGASPRTAYTPVSQSAVTGSGTGADPFRIVTVVDLGTSNLQVTQTDTYVVGEESYRTDIQLKNNGTSSADAIIYHAGDCFLDDNDLGFGAHDLTSGSVTCVGAVDDGTGNKVPGTRIEQFLPLSPGSHSYQAGYFEVWAEIGAQGAFDDTCRCDDYIDNGAGLSWNITVAAGQSVTRSTLTTFSPLGREPLITTKTADQSSVSAGGSNGYTITISNPNDVAVSLSTITDTLPAGFSYTPGSTTGATTSNPSISGQGLTWAGPFSVPAASGGTPGTTTLHFGVTASTTPGEYFNNAGGTSDGYTVAPSGETAKVTVTGATSRLLTVNKAGSGTGTVTSSPTGIDCGGTCSASFADGASVTLTGAAGPNSQAVAWSGCDSVTGANECVVAMNSDRTVTATFDLVNRTLTVNKVGNGTVTSSPGGINCGGTCSTPFTHGTTVTLTGTPGAGWSGPTWSGCDSINGSNQCVVAMTAARSVTATFALVAGPTCDGLPATIVGTSGNDNLHGTAGADVIVALGGNDHVNARDGADRICLGTGNDHAVGVGGSDRIFGEVGDDHIIGNEGNDLLDGGPGRDKCQGGSGANTEVNCE